MSSGAAEQGAQVADGLLVRLFRRRLVALGAAEGVLERHEHVVELGRLFVPALHELGVGTGCGAGPEPGHLVEFAADLADLLVDARLRGVDRFGPATKRTLLGCDEICHVVSSMFLRGAPGRCGSCLHARDSAPRAGSME